VFVLLRAGQARGIDRLSGFFLVTIALTALVVASLPRLAGNVAVKRVAVGAAALGICATLIAPAFTLWWVAALVFVALSFGMVLLLSVAYACQISKDYPL